MFLKLFSIFNNTKKKNSKSSSVRHLQNEIQAFTKHSSYNKRDLKHFKSLYGLVLLKKQEGFIAEALNAFLTNLKNKEEYKFFISKLLLSTFKTKNIYLISKAFSTVYEHHISFYREDKSFKVHMHKMFFIAINSCEGNNAALMRILLNHYALSWCFKTFSFENLLTPTIYKSVKEKDYKMYNTIMDSLNMKGNYSNCEVITNASIIALENNYIDFFNQDYSFDIYCNKEYSKEYKSAEFLVDNFFKFVQDNKFEAANNTLELAIKTKNSYFKFLHNRSYSNNNSKVISTIETLIDKNQDLLKKILSKIQDEIHYNIISDEALNSFNYQYLYILNKSNINLENKIELFSKRYFMPKSEELIKLFKRVYKTDNQFLNWIYDILHSRTQKELSNCIKVIKMKEKITSF